MFSSSAVSTTLWSFCPLTAVPSELKRPTLLFEPDPPFVSHLLQHAQVTKGKNRQQKMEAMLRLLAETSAPIEDAEKDELLHHMSSMYKVRALS